MGILTYIEERVLVRDERAERARPYVVSALGAIARPIRPLTGLRLWMGRLLGGLFSHAGGTDALRKARQRSRTMGGPMGPVLYRRFWTHGAQAPHDARLLSIALAGHYPSPSFVRNPCKRKKRIKQTRTGVTSNNHAVMRYYPSPIAQVRKKEDEQQHRFLSSLRSSQHCVLPGICFCFTFVKQLQAAARIARLVPFSSPPTRYHFSLLGTARGAGFFSPQR